MFEWLKIRRKPKARYPVFLGDLVVVPRSDFLRFFECDWSGKDTDVALKQWLSSNLEIPLLQSKQEAIKEYLVIDVLLSQYRTGGSGSIKVPHFDFFLLWRPFIQLKFRLTDGGTNKVLGDFLVNKKMGWRKYLNKALSWRGLFNIGGVFKEEDMHQLLLQGLMEGLQWAQECENT